MAVRLPHEFDGEEGEEELSNPQDLVDLARDLTASAENLASNIDALQRAQKAYTTSIRSLSATLSNPTALGAGLPERAHLVLSKINAATSESAQILSESQEGPLQRLRSGKLKQFSYNSDEFKAATQSHETAQAKLTSLTVKGKLSKSKLQQLQMGEGETRERAESMAHAARASGKAAEGEYRVTLKKVVRAAAFSQVHAIPPEPQRRDTDPLYQFPQLALHARGLELFTELMTELGQMQDDSTS